MPVSAAVVPGLAEARAAVAAARERRAALVTRQRAAVTAVQDAQARRAEIVAQMGGGADVLPAVTARAAAALIAAEGGAEGSAGGVTGAATCPNPSLCSYGTCCARDTVAMPTPSRAAVTRTGSPRSPAARASASRSALTASRAGWGGFHVRGPFAECSLLALPLGRAAGLSFPRAARVSGTPGHSRTRPAGSA